MIQFLDLSAQQKRISAGLKTAMENVLAHGQYILGPEVQTLEHTLCAFTKAKHVITCANGTDALTLLLMAKNVGPKDAVFVPTFTFASTAEVVIHAKATPIFIDVQKDTFNIDPKSLEAGIMTAQQLGLNPKGIIAVDLFGLPADYVALKKIANAYQLWLIDDAAQSFGSKIAKAHAGTFCEMTTTSFFPSKPLGCYGDGGAIFTDNDILAKHLRSLRVHGEGTHKYNYERIGLNSRLDTLQAAILVEKLKIFDSEMTARQQIAAYYQAHLPTHIQTPHVPENHQSAWALYTICCEPSLRIKLIVELEKKGIPTRIYYPKPLHLQTAYQAFPRATPHLPIAEALAHQVVSLPMHPYLTQNQLELIVTTIKKFTHETICVE